MSLYSGYVVHETLEYFQKRVFIFLVSWKKASTNWSSLQSAPVSFAATCNFWSIFSCSLDTFEWKLPFKRSKKKRDTELSFPLCIWNGNATGNPRLYFLLEFVPRKHKHSLIEEARDLHSLHPRKNVLGWSWFHPARGCVIIFANRGFLYLC